MKRMKKYLKIEKKSLHDEYVIMGQGGYIGDIAQGDIFKSCIVLYPESETEWTSECLRQVADKLDDLENVSTGGTR